MQTIKGKVKLGAYAVAMHGRGAHLLRTGPWSLWWVSGFYQLTPTQGRCATLWITTGLPSLKTGHNSKITPHCWVDRVMGLRKLPHTDFSLRPGIEPKLSRLWPKCATTAPTFYPPQPGFEPGSSCLWGECASDYTTRHRTIRWCTQGTTGKWNKTVR